MSVQFLAGFVSGIAGLIVGSPFDVVKTNLQQTQNYHHNDNGDDETNINDSVDRGSSSSRDRYPSLFHVSLWFSGILAPTLGLGFMNAILFLSYDLVMCITLPSATAALPPLRVHISSGGGVGGGGGTGIITGSYLLRSFVAGLAGGLCVCFVSVPTEVVKVRAQITGESSRSIVAKTWRAEGVAGFLQGFLVTVLRDAIGYGFYFLTYNGLCTSLPPLCFSGGATTTVAGEAKNPWATVVFGGIAGCVSWFSIFPLDTIKTRVQAQAHEQRQQPCDERRALLRDDDDDDHAPRKVTDASPVYRDGSISDCAMTIYREEGVRGFFRGLWITMFRAFLVNGVIFWADDLLIRLLTRG